MVNMIDLIVFLLPK